MLLNFSKIYIFFYPCFFYTQRKIKNDIRRLECKCIEHWEWYYSVSDTSYSEKKIPSSLNRNRTYDLPHTGQTLYHWATGDSWELRPSRMLLGLDCIEHCFKQTWMMLFCKGCECKCEMMNRFSLLLWKMSAPFKIKPGHYFYVQILFSFARLSALTLSLPRVAKFKIEKKFQI